MKMINLDKMMLMLLILVSTSLHAGTKTKYEKLIEKADKYYSWYAYPKSIVIYKKAIDVKQGFDAYAARQIAGGYTEMNQPLEAEEWYVKLEEHQALSDEDKVNYSKTLLQNGREEKAAQVLQSVGESTEEHGVLLSSISDKSQFFRDSKAYELEGMELNSDQNDFSPAFYNDGLVFVSNRKTKKLGQNTYYWDDTFFLDLFYDDLSGESDPQPLTGEINTAFHEGPSVFYDNGQKVIFTRNNFNLGKKGISEEGINHLNLYYAEKKKNGKWAKATPMPFNGENYSVGHPALTMDGKTLYFSSDRGGTFGKADIYKSELINGEWTTPENLGAVINTGEDEMFPYISDQNILYFASAGHPGMGGLDVYRVDLNVDVQVVENVGYPVNTENDDFGLILKENHGYLSSNRAGGKGRDDVYELWIHQLLVAAQMKDELTGEVLSGDIMILNQMDSAMLDEVHNETITNKLEVYRGRTLVISAKSEGYEDQVILFNTGDLPKETVEHTVDVQMRMLYEKVNALVLQRPLDSDIVALGEEAIPFEGTIEDLREAYKKKRMEIEKVYEISSIYYDFDKSNIRPDAAEELDQLTEVLKNYPSIKVLLWSHTDSRGSNGYNEMLAKKRAQSAKAYLLAHGISADRLFLDFSGEKKLVNDCTDGVDCPEPKHQNNRRTEISIKN